MALTYPQPITDDAIDLDFPDPQYENDFASIVGDWGTDSDGFETLFSEASQILIDAPDFLAGLDVALNGLTAAYPGVLTPWEQDFGDTITNAIAQGQPDFDQFGVDLTGDAPPAATGNGGGASPITITQSANCGAYGQSSIRFGDCPAGQYFYDDALPKVNVPDGPCTFIEQDGPGFMENGVTVASVSLATGDPSIWSVAHDTIEATDKKGIIHRVLITVTPAKVGHHLAALSVVTSRSAKPEIWCIICDVIDQAPASGGGGGTGTGTGGGGGTGPVKSPVA